jgi:hypothetical protein
MLFNNTFSTSRTAEFFQTAALRLLIILPFAVAVSNTVVDVVILLILLCWFLSGHWKERIAAVKTSPILWASLPLILWSFLGIFRSEGSLFDSLRYWNGHYPYFYIIVFATLLSKKENCYAILSSVNLAILLTWTCAFYLFCSGFFPEAFHVTRCKSVYLYRNTICFGAALVIWAGLWTCIPYTSRSILFVRKHLPPFMLDAMETAGKTSFYEFLTALRPGISSDKRFHLTSLSLMILRWGIVVFVLYYLFFANPSRTAQIAFLSAFSVLLLVWNRRYGFFCVLIFLTCSVVLSCVFSNNFQQKLSVFHQEIIQTNRYIKGESSQHDFKNSGYYMRAGTYLSLIPDIVRKPFIGYGMKAGRELVKTRTGYVDPHCEFLYIIIQQGLIGLVFFLLWWAALFYQVFKSHNHWNQIGVFLLPLLLIDCFFNCALSYHRETFIFIVLLSILALPSEGRTAAAEAA